MKAGVVVWPWRAPDRFWCFCDLNSRCYFFQDMRESHRENPMARLSYDECWVLSAYGVIVEGRRRFLRTPQNSEKTLLHWRQGDRQLGGKEHNPALCDLYREGVLCGLVHGIGSKVTYVDPDVPPSVIQPTSSKGVRAPCSTPIHIPGGGADVHQFGENAWHPASGECSCCPPTRFRTSSEVQEGAERVGQCLYRGDLESRF